MNLSRLSAFGAALIWLSVTATGLADDSAMAPPPATTLSVVLSNEVNYDDAATPVNPGTDLAGVAKYLYVTLTTTLKSDLDFHFKGRVMAESVPGLARGTQVIGPASSTEGVLNSTAKTGLVTLDYPEKGLAPGRYQLEVTEANTGQVAVTILFSTHYPTLPSPDVLEVALRAGARGAEFDDTVAPSTELPSWPAHLYITVTAKPDVTFDFTPRVVVEEVPGLAPGTVLGEVSNGNNNPVSTLKPENSVETATIALPRIGLPPGRYRLEIMEGGLPQRVVKSIVFHTRATELETPELNLVDSEFGGLLESVTDEDGAGYTWASLLLVSGNSQSWSPLGQPIMDSPGNQPRATLPCDLVFSFFQREPALVAAVELTSHDSDSNLPHNVEIWGSSQSATEGFVKLVSAVLEPGQVTSRIEVPPTEVRFLKLRIISVSDPEKPIALTGLRVLEGKASGYQPLVQRQPGVATWRLQPRHAAQHGLNFLQPTAALWQQTQGCLGCHVQSQTLMGISVAKKNEYVVSGTVQKFLNDFVSSLQNPAGDIARSKANMTGVDTDAESSNTILAALGMSYSPHGTPKASQQLASAGQWIAGLASDEGGITGNDGRVPIEQGSIMFTSVCLDIWSESLKDKPDPKLKTALDRGLAYVAQAEAITTQDKTFKIMTLARYGDKDQQKQARQLAVQIEQEQQGDGGWKIEPDDPLGTAAFSTGQVLYALRLAGINPNSKAFQRGVLFLMSRQLIDGSWRDPQLSTSFSATMWPVIALAGTFGKAQDPAHIIVTALPPPPLPPAPAPTPVAQPAPVAVVGDSKPVLPKNIEFVLDCSFSMEDRLGKSTRIETAKKVMRDVINHVTDDVHVGLRLYGHRFGAMSAQSSRDTELMLPIGPLDRAAFLRIIDGAVPNGQTPLVYSTLLAGEDIKKAGGGSIIVVTDGEESCGGDPRKGGKILAALGVPLRLDIIGFTLTGKRVVDALTAFTSPTGGRFYTAADGVQLATALIAATSPTPRAPVPPPPVVLSVAAPVELPPQDLPYEIFNAKGEKTATGSTLMLNPPDLEAGTYQVVLHDGNKTVVLDGIKLDTAETLELKYSPAKGALEPAQ